MLSPSERTLWADTRPTCALPCTTARRSLLRPGSTFLARFEKQVDPDGTLPEAECLRRAEAARKAHFIKMRLLQLKAQRRRSAKSVARKMNAAEGVPAAFEESTGDASAELQP